MSDPTNEQQDARETQHGTVVAVRDLADHPGAEEPSVTQVTIDFEPTSAFHEGQRVALPAVTRTEWGVRYGSALPFVSDERVAAEGFLEVRAPGGHLVRREVTAWTVADTPAADDEPRATHPNHWRRHGHEGRPCPPGGACYGGTAADDEGGWE